jgi:NTE family protein
MAPKKIKKRIAIACQGGGSHTAFTAGVLKKILSQRDETFDIVALSGTSGGAICAALTWYGLLTGSENKAIDLLDAFWKDNAADTFWDIWLNDTLILSEKVRDFVSLPEVNPYSFPTHGQDHLKGLLNKHINFEKAKALGKTSDRMLLVGAVDVLSGYFNVFKNDEVSAEALLASAAIPTLFRAVKIGDKVYWDGLFSQNPPVRDLTETSPDEIWVIQINPPQRTKEPTSIEEIRDRRNELAGNISLEQEIYFIRKINEFVKSKSFSNDKYKHIEVRRIRMLRDLNYSTKLERRLEFIQDMIAYGERQAEDFLKGVGFTKK